MAHRATNPEPPIMDRILADKATTWASDVLQGAPANAQHVLEALLAEYGVEAAVRALDNQGFLGEAMRPVLNPLCIEAVRRRKLVQPSWSPPPGTGGEAPLTDEEFEATLAELDATWEAMHGTQEGAVPDLPITREEIYRDHL